MSFDGLLLSGQPALFGSFYTAFIMLNKKPQDFFVIPNVIE